jgi:hypothetical protein
MKDRTQLDRGVMRMTDSPIGRMKDRFVMSENQREKVGLKFLQLHLPLES